MKNIIIILLSFLLVLSSCVFAQKGTVLFKNLEVSIYKGSAYFNGKELYNAVKDLERVAKQEAQPDCPISYRFYYNPLSLIGNYYSYESGELGELACGTPSNSLRVQTIDVSNNKAVSLTDIFTQESVLKALREDQWVKKVVKQSICNWRPPLSYDAFIDTINTMSNDQFSPNSFAILSYDHAKNQAAVRLVGQRYMGYNHNKHVELGLLLEPKDSFKYDLENNAYFTLHAFKNGLVE